MLSEISQSQKEKGIHLHEFLEEAKSWRHEIERRLPGTGVRDVELMCRISPSGYPGYSVVGGDEGGQQCEMYNS